ncbi:MAG: hypothetical protein [Podoviridae sp. ctg2L5]|nr:MAG: hypothetical protein [Podoviridae sp. ctg2L5]
MNLYPYIKTRAIKSILRRNKNIKCYVLLLIMFILYTIVCTMEYNTLLKLAN